MKRDGRGLVRSGLLSLLLVFTLAQPGGAYLGQVKYIIAVTAGSAIVRCGRTVSLKATVLEVRGYKPVKNVPVTWSIRKSPSSSDFLTQQVTSTNNRGRTSTAIVLSRVRGERVIKAVAMGVRGFTTVKCVRPRFRRASALVAGRKLTQSTLYRSYRNYVTAYSR